MADNQERKRRLGRALLAGGVAMALVCHLLGNWELIRRGGTRLSIASDTLGYDLPCYDLLPAGPEKGRVVFYGGFASGFQSYFPVALTLLRSGYAVRLAATSGSPNSGVPMAYDSHALESIEAARPFFEARPDVPHFTMGHSEGTRYAMKTASEIVSVDGVVLLSTVSASLDKKRPPNVLIMVAENDFGNIKQQTKVALLSGTRIPNPELNRTYGDLAAGTARRAHVVPGANHLSIAFDKAAQQGILDWLNQISGAPTERVRVAGTAGFPALAIGVLLGALAAVGGIGLLFQRADSGGQGDGAESSAETKGTDSRGETEKVHSGNRTKGIPAWAALLLFVLGWGAAAFLAPSIAYAQDIPLLAYGRILIFFAVAAVPLLAMGGIRPRLGAGLPRGSWKARAALFGATLLLLLFDRWLLDVVPSGKRLLWFGVAFVITGAYFACDEFIRRAVQRATDWQTGFALGLAGSFIAALSIAGAAFFAQGPVGGFLVAGAATLFVLLAACEIPATWLYETTGDWLLSWWVRVAVFNGFLAGLVPFVSEAHFRQMIH